MRLGARLAAGKLTLLSRSSAAGRTTDSEYPFLVGFVLFHGGKWKRSTRFLNRRYASARRILRSNDGTVSHHIWQSLKTQLKMRTTLQVVAPNSFEHMS
jgi:hypothetical protein